MQRAGGIAREGADGERRGGGRDGEAAAVREAEFVEIIVGGGRGGVGKDVAQPRDVQVAG